MSTILGQRIRLIREEMDLTQARFGHLIGVPSRTTISKFENGERRPSDEVLQRIADLADRPVSVLTHETLELNAAEGAWDAMLERARGQPAFTEQEVKGASTLIITRNLCFKLLSVIRQSHGLPALSTYNPDDWAYEIDTLISTPGWSKEDVGRAYDRIQRGETFHEVLDYYTLLAEVRVSRQEQRLTRVKIEQLLSLLQVDHDTGNGGNLNG